MALTSIRALVSKQKRRYSEDGYNLDLTYITPSIIAMGAPSKGTQGLYRNRMTEVQKFLKDQHGSSVCVYNLCSEERYAYKPHKFEHIANFPFDDHQVPTLELMRAFCKHADAFLKATPGGVVAVHCKAGKGRTGIMICCYLLYSKQCASMEEALQFYAEKRTYNGRGITNASQERYVRFFEAAMAAWPPLRKLLLSAAHLTGRGILKASAFALLVYCRPTGTAATQRVAVLRLGKEDAVFLQPCCLEGDVKLEVHRVSRVFRQRSRVLYSAWLHTGFLTEGQVTLSRPDLDKVARVLPQFATLVLTFTAAP